MKFTRIEDVPDWGTINVAAPDEPRTEAGLVGWLLDGTEVWSGLPEPCADFHIFELGREACVECGPPATELAAPFNIPAERLRPTEPARAGIAGWPRERRPLGYRFRKRFYSQARWLDYLSKLASRSS